MNSISFEEYNSSCSRSCSSKCGNEVKNWSEEQISLVKNDFGSLRGVELKNFLLNRLKFQQTSQLPICGFYYNNTLLCSKSLSFIVGVSIYIIETVISDFSRGRHKYIYGLSNIVKCTQKKVTFISWMKDHSLKYGQNGPTDVVTVLPTHINISEL